MGLFKKEEIKEKDIQPVLEAKVEIKKENDSNRSKRKNLSLFDVDTIQYVIENFPAMSVEIQSGLNSLSNILQNTIDYIEDRSSEIIKKNRDFKLSKTYRDTSVAIYNVTQNIDEYLQWMQQEYEKNIDNNKEDKNLKKEKSKIEIQEKNKKEYNESVCNSVIDGKEIEIYKDFSLKEPKGFKIKDIMVSVEDWDDLLVKTAEVLTKNYKKNKDSDIKIKDIKPIQKKSTQNSFRDTVIEMLAEYKINLDEFAVITR